MKLLSKALSKLSEHEYAYSLSLDLTIIRSTDGERPPMSRRHAFGPDWRFYRIHRPLVRTDEQFEFTVDTRAAASRTLRICLASIAQSRLSIESLSVFHHSLYCESSCHELRDIRLHEEGLRAAFKPLRSLSIRLCARVLAEDEKDEDDDTQKALLRAKDNFTGFRAFLSLMPALETLRVHWYTLSPDDGLRFFRELSAGVLALPCLRSCILAGLTVTEQSLLRFVQSVPLHHLALIGIDLLGFTGSFSSAFSYITQHSSIEHLVLHELHNKNHILFFDEKPCGPFPPPGTPTLLRYGAEQMRVPIDYTTLKWGEDICKRFGLGGLQGLQRMQEYGRRFGPRVLGGAHGDFDG